MLYDYSIHEEDRQSIIGALQITLTVANSNTSNISDKLLIKLLYNKIMFGWMTTKELYILLLKSEISKSWNPLNFGVENNSSWNVWHDTLLHGVSAMTLAMMASMSSIRDEEPVAEYEPFEPKGIVKPKPLTIHSSTLTSLGQSLYGRYIYEDMEYYAQPRPNYIPPEKINFFIRRESPQGVTSKTRFKILEMLQNIPNCMSYKYTLDPHP